MPRRRRTPVDRASRLTLSALLTASVVGSAVLVGCSTTSSPPAPPSSTDDGIRSSPHDFEVVVTQYRSDRPERLLAVEIRNLSPEALTVTGMTLTAAVLATSPTYSGHEVSIPSGATRAIRVVLPAPGCTPSAEEAEAGPGAEVALQFAGSGAPVVVPATDPYGTIARIAAEDCATEAVQRIARVTGADLRVEGSGSESVAHLEIVIEPSAASGTPGAPGASEHLELRAVEPTVLLSPQAGRNWPLGIDVAAADAPSSVELAVVPTRCDPHVIAEDKVGTRLTVVAMTGAGVEQRFPLPLRDGVKEQLLAFVAQHCEL